MPTVATTSFHAPTRWRARWASLTWTREELPDEKAPAIKATQSDGFIVAMAGDGNQRRAGAGASRRRRIAMGGGTDVAMASAGITLVKGDLRGIVRARRLSRATMRNIRQNLFFAFAYNVVGIPIAAGGALYPVFRNFVEPDASRRRR